MYMYFHLLILLHFLQTILSVKTYLVGVSLKMLTSMISLLIPSRVLTMSAMMLARDSMLSPS